DGKMPASLEQEVALNLRRLEEAAGKRFGDARDPLLVSVRSGAPVSMPGMMETILNLGLNNLSVQGLAQQSGNARFAFDSFRRFIQMYADVVLHVPFAQFEQLLKAKRLTAGVTTDAELSEGALRNLVEEYKALVRAVTGKEFPMDPMTQLWGAIEAVWRSWTLKKAVDYRRVNGIPETLGTAVSVIAMVFGNMGEDSGTGVAFTRNPSTGEKRLYGEFLPNAQGEDVVAGIRTPMTIAQLRETFPAVYEQFTDVAELLEKHYRDVQDIEFTVERGKLWMLQTRTGKRSAKAAVKIAVDMAREGLVTKQEAILRVEPMHVVQLLLPQFDERAKVGARKEGRYLTRGLNASPGAAAGFATFDPDEAESMGRDQKK